MRGYDCPMNDPIITEIADALMPALGCDDEYGIEIACDDIDEALTAHSIALHRGDIIMPLIRELIARGAVLT